MTSRTFFRRPVRARVAAAALALVAGHAFAQSLPTMTFSEKVFTDPRDVALGNAIEAGDLARIAALRAQGVSMRTIGRMNVTFAQVALHARQHAPEVMEAVLAGGADPEIPIVDGEAVPAYAVSRSRADPAVVDVLLKHGISPDWRPHPVPMAPGYSLMFNAVLVGNEQIVDLLIRRGAHIDDRDPMEGTALHLALGGATHYDVAVRLLDGGIDPSLRDHRWGGELTAFERYCERRSRQRLTLNDEMEAGRRRFLAAVKRHGLTLGCDG
jgi:hypothetical protein